MYGPIHFGCEEFNAIYTGSHNVDNIYVQRYRMFPNAALDKCIK